MINTNMIQQLKDYEPKRLSFPCLGQVKLDGIFGRWQPDKREFFTRQGNKIKGLDHLIDQLEGFPGPLDGELVIPGMDFFTMNGLIRSFRDIPQCKFYVFDRPGPERYKTRQQFYYDSELLIDLPDVVRVKAHLLTNTREVDAFYERVLHHGHEGAVYKQADALYRNGKHYQYMKRVPVKTVECEIIGSYEGKGKLEGMLGGFVVLYKDKPVKVGGGPGVDYAVRTMMWKERDIYPGHMMKVQYKKETAKGSLRSPQFLGIRWDI